MLVLPVALAGCAANNVTSQWCDGNIVANGSDNEWRIVPQYYDEKRPVAIRVTNNAEALYLCITTSDASVKRQLRMTGLTIWFDPKGERNGIFGIHLPGNDPRKPMMGPHPGTAGGLSLGNRDGASPAREPTPPPVEALNKLAITYSDATGPLTMTLTEVRRTGIDIGVGQQTKGRLVYEFIVAFKAAPSLSELAPGMVVGIGVVAGVSGKGKSERSSSDGRMGPGGPGGGMGGPGPANGMPAIDASPNGGGPKGSGPGRKGESLEVWLQARLAART